MKKIVITTELVETSPQALPLGAACIASSLKRDSEIRARYEIVLLDFSREDAKNIADEIARQSPSIVMMSVFVWNRTALVTAAKELRQKIPSLVLVAGGPEVTANPKNFERDFDYVVLGEGESKVAALVRQIAKLPPSDVPVIAAEISPYLDGTLDPEKYGGALWELARGCPFKCAYCYESKGESRVVHFPLERLKQELQLFKRKKISQIFVLDPTYNADKSRAAEMLDYIYKTAREIFFHFEVRSEFIDSAMAKKFARLNCSLQIGLQSANEQVLKNVNRNFNKKEFAKKIALLNDAGCVFGFDLIYGLPGDTLEIFKQSIDYAISLYPNHLEIFRLSVLPGTTLFDDAKKFCINFMNEPPYHILSSSTYTKKDLEVAEKIANASSIFYTQGRAVSFFNAILFPLKNMKSENAKSQNAKSRKISASNFFEMFGNFLKEKSVDSNCNFQHIEIEKLQIEFTKKIYLENNLSKLIPIATDLIKLNGALSRAYADGKTCIVKTHYHPDEVLSPYAQDLAQFVKYAKPRASTAKVFPTSDGSDFTIIS